MPARLTRPILSFFDSERASGVILIACTLASLLLSNVLIGPPSGLLPGDKTIGQIAGERKVASRQLTQWRNLTLKGLPTLFEDEQRTLQKERAASTGVFGDPYN